MKRNCIGLNGATEYSATTLP